MSTSSDSKKQALLNQLLKETYVTIRSSSVHGIGVFALVNIAKGQRGLFSNDQSEWIKITHNEINQLPEHSRSLIENHCLYDDDGYYVPEYGFKMIDPIVFINHSDAPNIVSIEDGEDFEAITDINAGQELFLDYGVIVDH
jgi:SET domain-containing protein